MQQHQPDNASNSNINNNNDINISPALAFCNVVMDWNATGVAFLQQGQHEQALLCFERGLNGFGICLQNIFMPHQHHQPHQHQPHQQHHQNTQQQHQNTATTTNTNFAAATTIREVLKDIAVVVNTNVVSASPRYPRTPPNVTPPPVAAAVQVPVAAQEDEDSMDTTTTTQDPAAPAVAAAAAFTPRRMGPLLQSIPVGRGRASAATAPAPTVAAPAAVATAAVSQQQQAQQSSSTTASSQQAKGQAHGNSNQQTNQQQQAAAVPVVVLRDVEDVFFDVYHCALVFIPLRDNGQHDQQQQAHYVTACLTHAAAVLLYNAGLTLHQLAEQQQYTSTTTTTRRKRSLDYCLAHETYRMALYLLEENVLHGVYIAPSFNILLLALFNNLGNLNGQHFFDTQRVLLCQEKLLCIFLRTEFDLSSIQQHDDYAFFYMQLLLSFTRTPLLAPAA